MSANPNFLCGGLALVLSHEACID